MGQDGKSIFNASTILTVFVGLILVVTVLLTIVQTAKIKIFWGDEKFEVVALCGAPFGQIIAGKITQSSNNPLYYLIQKFSLSQIDAFHSNVLVNVRRVSILAALLMCLLFFIFIHTRLGLLFAVFIVISVASQNIFYLYAAENRPYMLWLLLFAFLVMTTLKMCLQSYEKCSFKNKILFCISIIAITLVVSLGVIQSVMAILTCLFCWYCIHDRPKNSKFLIHFAIPLCLLCICIQGYYTLVGLDLISYGSKVVTSDWDLISQMQKGDISLLKMPPRLLLPKPGRDAYFGAYLSNFFVLLGMGIPFFWWKKRKNLVSRDFFVFGLSIVTSIQVAVTLIIALLVAFMHYYFVQRLFLYLIICHALLAMMGAYFVFSFNKKIMNFLIKGTLLILFCLSINWHWQFYSDHKNAHPPSSCQAITGYLDDYWQQIHQKTSHPRLDYIAEISTRLDDCGWAEEPPSQRVPLCSALAGKSSY